jgi:DNA-binding transcriptional LysR family regulator
MTSVQILAALATEEYGSISKAAEYLYISQPVVSKHISSLENELGFPLFKRKHSGVIPTPSGLIMLDCFKRMKNFYVAAINEASNKADIKKPLSVSLLTGLTLFPLQEYICQFVHEQPSVTLDICRKSSSAILDGLMNDSLDLAILFDNQIADYSGIEHLNLYSSELKYIMRSEHPLAKITSIQLSDIEKCNFVFSRNSAERSRIPMQIQGYCDKLGVSRDRIKWCHNFESIFTELALSDDITILDEHISYLENGRFTLLPTGITHNITVVWKSNNISSGIPCFAKYIFDKFHQ